MSVIGAVQLEVYSLKVPFCSRSLFSVFTKEFAVYKTDLIQGKSELKKNHNFELLGNKKTKLEEKKNTNLGVRYNLKFMKVRYVIQLRFRCTMLHIIVQTVWCSGQWFQFWTRKKGITRNHRHHFLSLRIKITVLWEIRRLHRRGL